MDVGRDSPLISKDYSKSFTMPDKKSDELREEFGIKDNLPEK